MYITRLVVVMESHNRECFLRPRLPVNVAAANLELPVLCSLSFPSRSKSKRRSITTGVVIFLRVERTNVKSWGRK